MPTVVSNSGPLIALAKLRRLDLLRTVFEKVTVTETVWDEVVIRGLLRGEADAELIRGFWHDCQWPIVQVSLETFSAFQSTHLLDPGEHETLAYAATLEEPLVLLDDLMGRKEARMRNLPVKGTLGIIVEAHRKSIIVFDEVERLLEETASRTDIWIDSELCDQVLAQLRSEQRKM